MDNISARFNDALMESSPFNSLLIFAKALKSEGMSQQDMHRLFDEYRERHEHDQDKTHYDAILDVMDFITGFCGSHSRLFDSDFRA